MTELRDARLRKAMEEAPDAQVPPPARVRAAIRAAAHGAVQPGWRRWWTAPQAHPQALRWIAFAGVALVVGGVVLGERWGSPSTPQEIPVAQAPAPVPSPDAPVAVAPVPAEPPAARAPEVAAAPQPAPRTGASPPPENARRARAPVLADAPQTRAEAPARPAPAEDRSAIVAAAPPPPTVAPVPDVLAKAAPPEARSEAAPAPAPAPALAPLAQAPAPRAVAPAAPAAALRASPRTLPWTQVRIESGGRSVVVPRMQAGELAALVTSVLAAPSEDAEPAPPGSLRLELAQGDESAGVLEVVGDRWRWTSLRESRRPRLLMPEPGVAAALRERAEALLRK